jgi:hypothetical protein
MNDPAIAIRLEGNGRVYRPGETLSGEYALERMTPATVKAVEVSVLWYSEGKGDEDLAVHEFWRRDEEEGTLPDARRPERFTTTLPDSPLSYDGAILKLRWCVRVRAFLPRGKEMVAQKEFRLGEVPAAGVPPAEESRRARSLRSEVPAP